MKKTLFCIAALAFAAVSCQKEVLAPEVSGGTTDIKAYAEAPSTKVVLAEDGTTHNMKASWETTDVIIGFKADGTAFQFAVSAVDPTTGKATLSQTTSASFTDGDKVYAIYNPGKTSADISESSLKVDFSKQTADVVPVLMLANATVAGGIVSFQFENAASIVGVNAPVYPGEVTEGKKVIKVTLSGHDIVSAGTVCVEGGKLAFKADAPKNFIEKSVSLEIAASGEGYTTAPVYIVAPAGPIAKVSVLDNKSGFFEYTIGKTAENGKYYDIKGKTFTKVNLPKSSGIESSGVIWAASNLTLTDYQWGDAFKWGDYKLIYSARTAAACTFLAGYEIGFAVQDGDNYYSASSSSYTKYNETDGLSVLDPIDDIVQILYPGSGWRMPSHPEFVALSSDSGLSKSYTNAKTTYTDADSKELSFSRSFASVEGTTGSGANKYWTSTVSEDSAKKYAAYYFSFNSNKAPKVSIAKRCLGYAIRPVKPVTE